MLPAVAGDESATESIAHAPDPALASLVKLQDDRIRQLEARLLELEAQMRRLSTPPLLAPVEPEVSGARDEGIEESQPKVRWLTGDHLPDFSLSQAEILTQNLREIKGGAIRIQFVAENSDAQRRAEWYAKVFAAAGWTVAGPEYFDGERAPASDLSLVTNLPVAPISAATFLAIRAAGFPVAAVYQTGVEPSIDRLILGVC